VLNGGEKIAHKMTFLTAGPINDYKEIEN